MAVAPVIRVQSEAHIANRKLFAARAPSSSARNLWKALDRIDPQRFFRFRRLPWLRAPDRTRLAVSGGVLEPPVDIDEGADVYLLSIEVPGIRREDLGVECAAGRISIRGEKRRREPATSVRGALRARTLVSERRYGSFVRSFALPLDADTSCVDAVHRNGVLQIRIPKRQADRTRVPLADSD